MERIKLAEGLSLSRIVHGQMRMGAWNLTHSELLALLNELTEMGVTTFDHADIYGNYSCERLLGYLLQLDKSLRNRIEIVTKCGIRLVSDKFPDTRIKHYDYSYEHIVMSVENSLRNFHTDHIDLLLMHRPAPLFNPEVVAQAFSDLKSAGKVLHFGVSNFTPGQYDMLNAFTEDRLVTNQVEISPWCLEHFDNGNIDFFMKERIHPMAWGPLAGGRLANPVDERAHRIVEALKEVAAELGVSPIDKVIYAWLLKHPSGIIPVTGTGRIERVRYAVEALSVGMNLNQWYRIYVASRGRDVA